MTTLSIIIPCYNESKTLENCIRKVLNVDWKGVDLEIIIVDDGSKDNSLEIARSIHEKHSFVKVIPHERNSGKGAALRTGIQSATGDFVAIQDADMEYDPSDLRRLLGPLLAGEADVVLGSRFMTTQEHRVLHFWHSLGNRCLTLLSNMFTDMNLTDMETCYKVFKRSVIQSIEIEENRFGFEPEVVAKIADLRCRVYEMGISYHGRTYEEGKKIGIKDGFRALYCIVKYNTPKAAWPLQFLVYLVIGSLAALLNLSIFIGLYYAGVNAIVSAVLAFVLAALLNYYLCIVFVFQHESRWKKSVEIPAYTLIVLAGAIVDSISTILFLQVGLSPWIAKCLATLVALIFNFLGRKLFVFGGQSRGPWK